MKAAVASIALGAVEGCTAGDVQTSEAQPSNIDTGSRGVTADIMKFGAVSGGDPARNRRAIQDAVDSLRASNGGLVYVPAGKFTINETIWFDSNVTFQGANVGASIVEGASIATVFGKRGLPEDLTRAFHVFFRDVQITNRSASVGVGIDFTNVSQGGVNTVKIEYVRIGIRLRGQGDSNGAHYVDLYSPLISTVYIAIECHSTDGGAANENHVFGGRIADCATAIELKNVNNFQINGTAMETCGTGVDVQEATDGTKIIGCRFETNSGPDPTKDIKSARGIRVSKQAKGTTLLGCYFEGRITDIEDYSSSTTKVPVKTRP